MTDGKLLSVGIIGTVIAALCCFTPILVILFGAIGLSALVVWSGVRPTHGTAANTLCTVLAFFSSDEGLEKWRLEEHPDERGYPLSMQEGLEVGKAIFGPMLRASSG